MKNKLTLILIWLLIVTPSLVNGYNPTNEELRGALFDYIGTQSRRQQYQDILDAQNKSYDQLFDSYYQSTNNLENELNYKLKELEMKEDAEKRASAWQKEKQLLDRELELIRKEQEFRELQKKLEIDKNSKDLIQFSEEITGGIIKARELQEKSTNKNPTAIKPFNYETSPVKSSGLPVYSPTTTSGSHEINNLLDSFKKTAPVVPPTITAPTEDPAPRKNIFKRFWNGIINFF